MKLSELHKKKDEETRRVPRPRKDRGDISKPTEDEINKAINPSDEEKAKAADDHKEFKDEMNKFLRSL